MTGAKSKPPGLLRRTDVAVTARIDRVDVDLDEPRAIALASDPAVVRWIMDELMHTETLLQHAASVDAVIDVLFGTTPPHPQILVVDFDPLSAAEVFQLHELRARGWFGAIIGLGTVSPDLRTSLAINRVLARPLDEGSLERAVDALGLCNPTVRVQTLKSHHFR